MKKIQAFALTVTLFVGLGFGSREVNATPIDFESFTDSFPLTNEISGITFSGGTILSAGVSLNEIDYPPSSGTNVLAALAGSLTISAVNPFDQFSAYFTFADQLTFSGFDVANNLLFSFKSPTSSNLGSNSLIGLATPGISSLLITAQGDVPFIMDDLDFSVSSTVPEPGTLVLLLLGWITVISTRHQHHTAKS